MMVQSDAVIYLASQRSCTETNLYRSYHSIDSDNCGNNPTSRHQIIGFHDDVLAGKSTIDYIAPDGARLIIVPVVGRFQYCINNNQPHVADVGQVHSFFIRKGEVLKIENHLNYLINYIHIWFREDKCYDEKSLEYKFNLSQNIMIPFSFYTGEDASLVHLCIGKFGGRAECIHKMRSAEKGAFIFVLEGAFEVNDRLLQARDGLALWNAWEIEFEALSNDAILFILEC